MNPFRAVRKTLHVVGTILKWLLLALAVAGCGLVGQYVIGPWGWVLGPVAVTAFFVGVIYLTLGYYSVTTWWARKERDHAAGA